MKLAGRFVLLTGGSRGLGPVIAERLARAGAHVAVAARSADALRRVSGDLAALGVRALAVEADVARAEDRERLVARVREEFGRIDVLVNNAGVEDEGAFADLPWETVRRNVEVNFTAPVHISHLVLPEMLARREGHLVQVASLAAKIGVPFDAIYSGAKAGLGRWSEGLRREIAGSGVGVSTVFPGFVRDVGMFARFGMRAPTLVGSCTPAQVAAAVEGAITHDRPDVIVNSLPMRPAVAIAEIFPSLGDGLMRRIGVVDFQRRKVGSAGSATSLPPDSHPR